MKATKSIMTGILSLFLLMSCKEEKLDEPIFSGAKINEFLGHYPEFAAYRDELSALYKKHENRYVWYDQTGRNDFAEVLYNRARQIETEGIPVPLPYKDTFEKIFDGSEKPKPENELLISSMYFFYAKKVFEGLDPKKSSQLGWYLPRDRKSYVDYLDQLMQDESLIKQDEDKSIAMYYNLRKGLQKYQQMKKSGQRVDADNVPIDSRIKTIMVNMERCRWLSPEIADAKEYIAVNIPSFKMRYVRDGKTALESDVIVGDEANKTVVFSGKMSYLVFSPYWNIPQSIVDNEILPELDKDENYLAKQNMEWHEKRLRQRPGGDNSLGLVKFMFPNSNNIYLHDTPAKTLFKKEDRALSHGCIRVAKARDLAMMILDEDKNWTPKKIDDAMRAGTETQYALKRKIPVYIAYFTALADESGNVRFFDDVYKRDAKLAKMLYTD